MLDDANDQGDYIWQRMSPAPVIYDDLLLTRPAVSCPGPSVSSEMPHYRRKQLSYAILQHIVT